jgi:hypothetical protein
MIHIITVHWKDDRWIDIQLEYLKKHIKEPYRVYTFLNYIETDHSHKFFYASKDDITSHATKLNILAEMVCKDAPDSDWLLFIDGDAFPINDVVAYAKPKLSDYPLLAVQRLENLEDKQPHPLFCITTVGFWKKIKGDWEKGYMWQCKGRMATDVGGNLLGILEREQIEWFRILRSNKKNLHNLNFAIYDDLVYHHGASFRRNISRFDKMDRPFRPGKLLKLFLKFPITKNITFHYNRKHEQKIVEENKKLSDEIFELIKKDREFYNMFK